MSYSLTIWHNNEKNIVQETKNQNLLDLLLQHGYEIKTYCGGKGICGKCKVKVLSGVDTVTAKERELLDDKEIEDGIRLACLTEIKGDMEIELEATEDIVAMTSGIIPETEVDVKYNKFNITLDQPSLDDQRDIVQRIYDKINVDEINYNSIIKLNKIDKEESFTVVTRENKIVDIETDNNAEKLYGLAIDIGTTTIVLYLIDLKADKEIDVYSLYNPQKKFGADVISRINYTVDNENGIAEMHDELLNGLNKGLDALIKQNNISRDNIYLSTVVGNTVMLHTLLGISAEAIAVTPYIPLVTDHISLKPEEIGIKINKNGLVQLLPSISGYIGADIVGDMLAVNFNTYSSNIELLIDIGTNGEIALSTGEKFYTCSTAAGPAFEGANITFGMAGIPGAISEFEINDKGESVYKTVADKKPEGICGSGLLDVIAQLFEFGLIKSTGAFISEDEMTPVQKEMMTTYKDMPAFIVVPAAETNNGNDILVTQKDIREVQLAKGAIQSGIKILRKEVGLECEDIDKVYLAGGFGNYMNPHSACTIGLLPAVLEDKIIQIGNGAGTGAKIYLLDKKAEYYVQKLKERVEYIELSKRQDFQTEFMGSMQF